MCPSNVIFLMAVTLVVTGQTKAATEKLGRVNFPISCKSQVKPTFTRGVALLHSFSYEDARKAFKEVVTKDPACGIAQWGIAMSYLHIIWAPPTEEEFAAGRAAALKAASLGASTAREKDYITAIGTYYQNEDVPHPARVAVYEQAMANVAKKNTDDHEATIFHALAILGNAYNSPPDKTYIQQKRAADMLNQLLPLELDHPGVAHYIIHAYDYPELASQGLPAAKAYLKIAPSAPHALHMSSHIFTRLGFWQESIESNLTSAKTAQLAIAHSHPGAISFDTLHAWDYLEYAYLQTGQDSKARDIVLAVAKVSKLDAPQFAAGYALAAIPARYALERRAWTDAANLALRPTFFPWDKYSYAEAITHFARSVGGARSGDLKTANTALEKLTTIQTSLRGKKGFDWATQVEVLRLSANGWISHANKKDDEALKFLRAASDLEDTTDKHPVTPGAILPAREQLADLLSELGQHAAAVTEYEVSLRSAPARFNSYNGAAKAAELSGQREKAKNFRKLLMEMCGGSIPARIALQVHGK